MEMLLIVGERDDAARLFDERKWLFGKTRPLARERLI